MNVEKYIESGRKHCRGFCNQELKIFEAEEILGISRGRQIDLIVNAFHFGYERARRKYRKSGEQ